MKLTDNSPMPFGVHKGTKMANVPAKYLLWIYEQNLDVMNYIKENMEVLQKEVNKRK
ncbi:MAG: putative quorum-sensing-regulated virulence factor [Dysgonomonas sp.]